MDILLGYSGFISVVTLALVHVAGWRFTARAIAAAFRRSVLPHVIGWKNELRASLRAIQQG